MTGVKVDQLKEGFAGEVVRPGDDEYDCLRAVFNGMIDGRPAAIARCTGVGEVVAAVNCARARGFSTRRLRRRPRCHWSRRMR